MYSAQASAGIALLLHERHDDLLHALQLRLAGTPFVLRERRPPAVLRLVLAELALRLRQSLVFLPPSRSRKPSKWSSYPPRQLRSWARPARAAGCTPRRTCAAHAGLRLGELSRLQWRDLNWTTGELTVASRRGGHTKNYQSRRIPLNSALTEDLRRHPRNLNSDYVFANSKGEPYRNVRRSLKQAATRAGIDGFIGLHQCRHAFCSHCLMRGIDPRTVQGWMGHKDLNTTMRYAHISPDHEKAAIQRLSYDDGHQVDTTALA